MGPALRLADAVAVCPSFSSLYDLLIQGEIGGDGRTLMLASGVTQGAIPIGARV